MALRVLGVFGLKAATSVPVQLLRLVKMEKSRRLAWDGPDASALHTRVNTAIDQFAAADEDSWKRVKFARVRRPAVTDGFVLTSKSLGQTVGLAWQRGCSW
jgi:hypothetical protein